MFSEDVVLGGPKAGPSWFISDHILRMDSGSGDTADVARHIADRNDLRYEGVVAGGVEGVRFWRISFRAHHFLDPLSLCRSCGELPDGIAQSVEISLKLRHSSNVGSHFVVDVLDAAVNVMDLLCYVLESTRASSRPNGTGYAGVTSGSSGSPGTSFALETLTSHNPWGTSVAFQSLAPLDSLGASVAFRSLGSGHSGGPGRPWDAPLSL
jgi:hypothetical protein